jgi:hypothetical protein
VNGELYLLISPEQLIDQFQATIINLYIEITEKPFPMQVSKVSFSANLSKPTI